EEAMHDPVSVGMLALNGEDIMKELNVPPGPKIGQILHALLEEVLEGPKVNTRALLLEKARELAALSEDELKKRGDAGKEKREAEDKDGLNTVRARHHVA